MKKLNGQEAKLIKEIINKNNSIIEMDNKQYFLTLIEEPKTTVFQEKFPNNSLKRKVRQTKMDILNGKDFSIDDVVEMMEMGEL